MTDEQLAEKAITAVQKEDEDAENVRAGPIVHEFLDGTLVIVYADYEIADDEDEDEDEDEESYEDEFYVFIAATGNVHVFSYPVDLVRAVAAHKPSFWRALGTGVIPGVIAIGITITICYLAVTGNAKAIPEVLTAALATILGFYFGSQVARR